MTNITITKSIISIKDIYDTVSIQPIATSIGKQLLVVHKISQFGIITLYHILMDNVIGLTTSDPNQAVKFYNELN